jgi:hypothetical protein
LVRTTTRRIFLWESVAFGLGASFFDLLPAAAQAVRLITYQGRLTDAAGVPANSNVPMSFRILDGNGVALWSETYPSVPVANGFFTLQLGKLTPLTSTMFEGAPLDSYGPVRFLEVTINGETVSPNLRLTSAVWAITGEVGPQGSAGIGPQGSTGFQGAQGGTGPQGSTGAQGLQGPQGQQGSTGIQGAQGTLGRQGMQGSVGNQGFQGFVAGIQGFQGGF